MIIFVVYVVPILSELYLTKVKSDNKEVNMAFFVIVPTVTVTIVCDFSVVNVRRGVSKNLARNGGPGGGGGVAGAT